jgi:hypothetical protein
MLLVFAMHAVQVMVQQKAPPPPGVPSLVLPSIPKVEPILEPSPEPKPKRKLIDTGWWTRAHAAAMMFDGASTLYWERTCHTIPEPCKERYPAVRWLVGSRPPVWRMGLVGSAIVLATAMIPNKKVRRAAQIAMIVIHIEEGTRNFARRY